MPELLMALDRLLEQLCAGTSHFDALQLSLQKKFAQGWMLNTQYMWSSSRNDGSVGGGEANAPEDKNCLR